MLIIIMSSSGLKLGHVGSKTRLLCQILEKPCLHSRRHSFDQKFMKLCQNVKFEIGSGWVKIRLLGQILEKPCVHSRGQFLSKVYETLSEC